MVVSLMKGQRMSFAKENPGLRSIILSVQWNVKGNTGPVARELDIDMSAFLLDQTGKCKGDSDIVFYGNTSGRKGAVVHTGKQQRGALVGEGLKVEFSTMPMDVETVAVTLSIYEAGQRQQDFSMIQSLSASVSDGIKGSEICRFDVNWNFTIETAIVLCELYKKNGEWRFNAVGAGYQGGLSALCKSFGIEVNDEEGSKASSSPPVNHMPPPQPPRRVTNEPVGAGNAGVGIGGRRQINLSNPHTQVNLNSSGSSGPSSNPAPRKFNFSQQNMGMPRV